MTFDRNTSEFTPMKSVVWGLIVLLILVHQDVWFWSDNSLVFGFMPITLVFHAGISIAASITWYLATKYCWPDVDNDDSAPAASEPSPAPSEPAVEGGASA